MKIFTIVISALLLNLSISAQAVSGLILGRIVNTKNEGVASATVELKVAGDSTFRQVAITDADGTFRFMPLSNGIYRLFVSAVGLQHSGSTTFTVDDLHQKIVLPAIVLQPAKATDLAAVVIKAKRPLLVQEIDRTIVHVDAMISSASSNTMEVLEKTPGISINSTGEINLNGRGALVLIDGRSTYMSGQDLAAYLKSIPGSVLDKIELMDNPPAKYDAAGNAIINIRFKKNRTAGFTGSIATGYSQGRYTRGNDALNLNYNHKKINLFANLGFNHEKNYTADNYDRYFFAENGGLSSTVFLQNNQRYKTSSTNLNTGFDFSATSKTTIGMVLNLNNGKRNGYFDAAGNSYDKEEKLQNLSEGNNTGGDTRHNTAVNLNGLHKFNDQGRELSGDINYLHYKTDGNQMLESSVFSPGGTLITNSKFQYLVPSVISIYTARADYTHPLKNKAKLEAGIKSSVVDNNNVANYYDLQTGQPVIDYAQSNHFKYHENLNAGYVNFQKSWRRWSTQLGFRVENTRLFGNQLGNAVVKDSNFHKNYTSAFPSAFLSYKLDSAGGNTLTLLLVKRINRPNYYLLNPFVFFRDQYSYTTGNPLLNPQYQYRVEAKYTHKQVFRTALSYNRFTNVIFQTTQAIDTIFITRPQNIARGFMVLLNTGISLAPAKWWNLNLDILLSHMGLNGKAYTENLTPDAWVARINLLNQFRFNKGWSAEAGGYYASTDLNGQAVTSGMIRMNAAVQKKILKDKGSIRFSIDDIFHSWVYQNRSVSVKQSQYFQVTETDTQRAGVAFTYSFGKPAFARKRKHSNNASDEERGRVD